MRCPTCAYAFEPSRQLRCPRCGESLDCAAVDCGTCGACPGSLAGLTRWLGAAGRADEDAGGS